MPHSKPSHSSFKDLPLHTSSRLSIKHVDMSLNATRKKLNAAGALLKNKHPELFFVAPRPGGFVKHITSPHKDPSRSEFEDADTKARSELLTFQNKRSTMIRGTEITPLSIYDVLQTQIPCPTFHRFSQDQKRNNMVRMCSITISTVIMLAQHTYKNITFEHVKHTEAYFRALRQEDGYPQNIGQLMQVLANLKRTGKIVSPPPDEKDSNDEVEDPKNIEMSDIIN